VVNRKGGLNSAVETCPVALNLAGATPRWHPPLGLGLWGLEKVLVPRLARMAKITIDRDERAVKICAHERRQSDKVDVKVIKLCHVSADK